MENHVSNKDPLSEASEGSNVSGWLTSVTIFFTGLLISQFDKFGTTIRLPILFLIISTFGFLFSMIIYSNATGTYTRLKGNYNSHILSGNIISEYLGLFPLVFAIPLVLNAVVNDSFLKYSVLVVALLGFYIYHKAGYSILQRHFKQNYLYLFTILSVLEIGIFYTQHVNTNLYFALGIILIVSQSLIALRASKLSE